MAFSFSPLESDADLEDSRDYCQARISQLRTDFTFVRAIMSKMDKDPKELHRAVSLWARTFRQCEAAHREIAATRSKAPTMSGLDTSPVEMASMVVEDATTWVNRIGAVRKALKKKDLLTIDRLSQDSALVDKIRDQASTIAKPKLSLNLGTTIGGMT